MVSIEYNGVIKDFTISPLVSKRSKDELDPEKQFLLLNAFLDYKGDSFKQKLMDLYVEADNILMSIITRKDLTPLPYKMVHNILDMFDSKEVKEFARDTYGIKPPPTLKDSFNNTKETDGDLTRAQTYLNDDYYELAALATIIKTVLPVIGEFAYVKNSYIDSTHKEHILFNFITTHPIYNTRAMKKVYDFIDKLVTISFKKEDVAAVRVIEKRISRDDMTEYILASVIFSKISIASTVDDDVGKNVITRMYNYIINKLNVRNDVQSAIRGKKALSDSEGGEGERESIAESYRVVSSLPKGWEVEINYACSDRTILANNLNVDIDMNIVEYIRKVVNIFTVKQLSRHQTNLVSIIFKDIIDPRSFDYLDIDSVLNLLSVGFAYLWAIDCKYIAILITSIPEDGDGDVMTINTTVNRTRLTKEYKDILMDLYPYTRVINSTTSINIVEEFINSISNEIFDLSWSVIVGSEFTDGMGGKHGLSNIPADLKNLLADMIIKIERNR